jgi:hypothetical protein
VKTPSKKAGILWLIVVGLALWWLLSSSPAAAAERPLYGPPTPDGLGPDSGPPTPTEYGPVFGPLSPPKEIHGDVDFEDPTVIASEPDYQAGSGGYYTYREE